MAGNSENTTVEQFRADAVIVGHHIGSAHVEPEADTPSLSGEFVIKAGAAASEQDLRVKGGGVESVSGTSGSNFTASIFEALREKDRQRREANSQLITFLEMLNAIDRQIAMLDAQIAEYEGEKAQLEEQLGALEELKDLLESGELDPTNPEHMRLLELSGIPRDQWGVVTADMLDDRIKTTKDRIEELEDKIRKAKDTRTKLEDQYDDIHEKMDNDPDAKADPETQIIAQETREDFYDAERQLSESESEWFHRVISVAPRADWDALIEKLEDRSFSDLKNDQALSLEVRDYMRICQFEDLFEQSCVGVPDEEHHYVLLDLLETATSVDVKAALLRSNETPEYMKTAMSELGMLKQDPIPDPHLGRDQ